jgi:hypothetical protein
LGRRNGGTKRIVPSGTLRFVKGGTMFLLTNKGPWKSLISHIPAIIFLIVLLRQWHSKYMVMEEIEDIEVNRYSPAKGKRKWLEDRDQELEGFA